MATSDPSLPSSPYFLHPNENPSLVLVTPTLTSLNYNSWSRAMRMALLSKNKLKFVDSSILPPVTTDSIYPAWERCNNMVISWLHHSISESIVNNILLIDTAHEIWRDLHERFSQGDVFRISDLYDEISIFKQEEHSVTDYFTELKVLWDELLNFRPLPSCSCRVQCSCGAFTTIRKYHNNEYVIRFLKGLNEQYASVRSQIMLLDPLLTINKAFSMVIQQEQQLLAPSSTIFASNADTVDTCYHKNGFPPGYRSRNSTSRVHNVFEEIDTNTVDSITGYSPPVTSQGSGVTLTQEQITQALPFIKMIGTARVLSGLYLLDCPVASFSVSTPTALQVSSSSTLWHHRLGHLSNSRLKLLSSSIPNLSFSSDSPCKTCHLAKQKKLSFPVSHSLSNKFFDLIHVDIWGPNGVISITGHRYF
ncbi:uncharacterized protein [Gossypium hirsutum]|uniref:Retrovirus-related Pol polyprotein from transposon TNT 1-94 n=1 Tax=Gossypium hirsutum TaxID=3635 RepID=A0ABM3A1C8_GOSHI|nr:uncharacterized protein LOC121217214 [Gossypium hirsutum]